MAEPTFRQRRLDEALQLLRERAGVSQKEAVDRLSYNVPKRVRATALTFKHLSKLALSHEESAAWIERLAAER